MSELNPLLIQALSVFVLRGAPHLEAFVSSLSPRLRGRFAHDLLEVMSNPSLLLDYTAAAIGKPLEAFSESELKYFQAYALEACRLPPHNIPPMSPLKAGPALIVVWGRPHGPQVLKLFPSGYPRRVEDVFFIATYN